MLNVSFSSMHIGVMLPNIQSFRRYYLECMSFRVGKHINFSITTILMNSKYTWQKPFLVYISYINIIILPLAMKIRGSSRRNSQGIIIYQPAWLFPSKLEYFNCKFNLHIKSPEIKEWILLWMSLRVQHINIWTLDQWYTLSA